MHVRRVLMPTTGLESWTVLDGAGPVEPVERWLAYLTAVEKSPNTIKAYSHDLKDWFTYLTGRGLDWRKVQLEDLGDFVAWLRLPPAARAGQVQVLPSVEEHCRKSSIARKLSALSAFYEFHTRHGVDLGELLVTWRPYARGHPRVDRACLRHHAAAGPKSGCVGLSTFQALRELQLLLAGCVCADFHDRQHGCARLPAPPNGVLLVLRS
jgi:integrase/recombinase XerD